MGRRKRLGTYVGRLWLPGEINSDEDAEAEKIRVLEQRMALFNGGGADPGSASAPAVGGNPELSDSSSDSDSSGSESE